MDVGGRWRGFALTILVFFLVGCTGSVGKGRKAGSSEPTPIDQVPNIASCLEGAEKLITVSGVYDSQKYAPDVEPNLKFDAREATFIYPEIFSHAMVTLGKGQDPSPNMCWVGGYFTSSLSWHGLDVSWEVSKKGPDDTEEDRGEMNNTTSATTYHEGMVWSGIHVYNMHDGIRTTNSPNWTVQHVWFEYIRDDCIENDNAYSGTVYDVLLDGCYTGISVKGGDGAGQTIKMDRVLLRMEPMPYPYKWDEKDDPVVNVPGFSMPFGHGSVFKADEDKLPMYSITNSVFLQEYDAEKRFFPPKENVAQCENNIIIWLDGPATAPTHLLTDFPGCFQLITDREEGLALWKEKVADWHERHPDVGALRKPANPGEYRWPRFCPDGYILVPGNAELGTSDFCVMQFEAKAWNDANEDGVIDAGEIDVNGCGDCSTDDWATIPTFKPVSIADEKPWRRISQIKAREACEALNHEGESRYALISNPEWMTIARNIENQDINWTGGTIGNGSLFQGNIGVTSDSSYNGANPEGGTGRDTKARHVLSNGKEIWDLSGNVYEWLDWFVTPANKAYFSGDGGPTNAHFLEFNVLDTLIGLADEMFPNSWRPTNPNYDSTQGIGKYMAGKSTTGGAARRGGNWGGPEDPEDKENFGIFTLYLHSEPTGSSNTIGFRCVYRL